MLVFKKPRGERQAGDSLVEVMLAFAVMGLVVASVTRIMNDTYSNIFASGQRSQVESLAKGQLAILRAAHDREVASPESTEWDQILTELTPTNAAVSTDGCVRTKRGIGFNTETTGNWMTPTAAILPSAAPGNRVTPTEGLPVPGVSMWIEVQFGEGGSSRDFYDFYVKSCYGGVGGVPQQSKSVLRLYRPSASTGNSGVGALV